MMKAMGWTEGQTLGRDDGSGKGLVAPIILHGNDGSAGLGAAPPKRSIVDGDPVYIRCLRPPNNFSCALITSSDAEYVLNWCRRHGQNGCGA